MATERTWSRLHRCVLGALLATLFSLTFTTLVAHAAGSIVVNDLSDSPTAGDGKCTFREASNNAEANADTTNGDCLAGSGADTITFGVSGTIASNGQWPAVSESVTIDGRGRSITISGSNLIINANTTVNLTALTIANSSGIVSGPRDIGGGIVNSGTLTITDCTISDNDAEAAANGALTFGGGIYNTGGTVNVIHSSFSRNHANYGGIYNSGGTVNVTASTVSNNVPVAGSLSGGGGIYNDSGTVTITSSTFTANANHGSGDGMYTSGGTVNVIASTLSGNAADQDGGGIYSDGGAVNVTTSTLSGNSAGNGGGIYTLSGSVTVTSSTLSGNTATSGNGGGILDTGSGSVTVINSTFSGNSASSNGGSIANDSTLTLANSTVSGNTATSGGGIDNTGNATLKNTIVANSPSGGNCRNTGSGTLSANSHDLVDDGSCGGATQTTSAQIGLGPLANNGGPTQTMALSPGSAALDAGDSMVCGVPPVNNIDQRGVARPQAGIGLCDSGAFEARFTLTASVGGFQPTGATQPFPFPLVVTFGGPDAPVALAGVPVTFTAPFSGPSATLPVGTFTTNGVGQTSVTATANGIAGSYIVTARTPGASVTFALTNLPGRVASFAITGFPTSTVAGVAHTVTITAKDASGNTVPDYSGIIHFTSSDGAAILPADYYIPLGDTGTHTVTVTLKTVGPGRSITATDVTMPSITGTQSGIAVTPAVHGVSPINGAAGSGNVVTIAGIGLTGATSVTLGGGSCTNIAVNGPGTSLTCTAPTNHPAGTVDIVVTTPNGVGMLAHGYTFLPPYTAPAPSGRTGDGSGSGGASGGASAPAPAPTSRNVGAP